MYAKQWLSVTMLVLTLAGPTVIVNAQGSGAGSGGSAVTAAKIFYSGRMLGYLRQDIVQDKDKQEKDKKDRKFEFSGPAQKFLDAYHAECKTPCILLGMGDNFSPEYKARLDDDNQFKSRKDPGPDYRDDNVARFLDAAGFSALVPGKEDFYFGAYRLWKIADSLNQNRRHRGVAGPFLADNLVLVPKDEKHRESSKKSFTDHVDGISTDFSGRAMPWLVRLAFKFDPSLIAVDPAHLEGHLCDASTNPDELSPQCETWPWDAESKSFVRIQNKQSPHEQRRIADRKRGAADRKRGAADLEPGWDYGFCIAGIAFRSAGGGSAPKQYCLPIHVEVPMFHVPYILKTDPQNNTEVAIFAVVDVNFRSYMPKQNAGWDVKDCKSGQLLKKSILYDPPQTYNSQEPDRKKVADWMPHRVEVDAVPPKDALEQALDAFQLDEAISTTEFEVAAAAFRDKQAVATESLSLATKSLNLNGTKFSGVTVLMAQMDYDTAEEFARHVEVPKGFALRNQGPNPAFDLVIARADIAHETRAQETVLHLAAGDARPRFVVGPPPAFDEEQQEIRVPLGSVTLTRQALSAHADFTTNTEYCGNDAASGVPQKVPPPEGCVAKGISDAWKELQKRIFVGSTLVPYEQCYRVIGNKTPDDCGGTKVAACLMKFATCAMLQDNKGFDTEAADTAFLQTRDVWDTKEITNNPAKTGDEGESKQAWRIQLAGAGTVQEILDKIFWKDDLLAHSNLSGSQLKALIKESAGYKKDENNPLWILHDTSGRGLEPAGLLKGTDPKPGTTDPSLYAHLEELSDTSLYRVAASSYISNGDTVYPEFAKPGDGGKVTFFRRDKKGVRISVLVCEALAQGATPPGSQLYHCGEAPDRVRQPQVDETYYAVTEEETQRIAGLIHDNRKPDGNWEYVAAQLHELAVGHDRSPEAQAAIPRGATEKVLQSYPYLDVNLINLSVAGNLNTALATRAETANFTGVLNSDIPQPTKSEFSWLTSLRILDRRAHGKWDVGGSIDEKFDKSVQGSLTKASSPNWSANNGTVGPIVQYSISDPRRGPRHLLSFHPFDYTRQITNTSLTLTGMPGSASFTFSQRPSHGEQFKGGFRYESGDSYFEVGGLYVRNSDVLSQVSNLPGGNVCNLSDTTSLAACVGKLTLTAGQVPVLHYNTFDQAGIYWDSKFNLDVIQGKWGYQFTSKGNYNPKSDQISALTRLDTTVSNGLKFQLIGNLSVVPSVELRFFETERTYDFLKRINTKVALTYTFHKESRVNLWDAMHNKLASAPAP